MLRHWAGAYQRTLGRLKVTLPEIRILGAVIAGGKSSRFGGDKAVALVDDLPLIDHVVMGLYRHAEAIVIAGRDWRDFGVVDDGAYAGQGPLAGLLAALNQAEAEGFDAVLSAACDALPVPDMKQLVGAGPAVIDGHWLFGFWPVALAKTLDAYMAGQADRSVRGWITHCGARFVEAETELYNLNTKADIMLYERTLEQDA
jgi:molybdenum cofactor guanylyltransferase